MPFTLKGKLKKGMEYYGAGAYDEAISYFSEVLKKNPSNFEATYWMAQALLKQKMPGRARKARLLLEKRLIPEIKAGLEGIADSYAQEENYQAAIGYYGMLLAMSHYLNRVDIARAYYKRAEASERLADNTNDDKKARESLEAAKLDYAAVNGISTDDLTAKKQAIIEHLQFKSTERKNAIDSRLKQTRPS